MGEHEKKNNIESDYFISNVAQTLQNKERSHTIDTVKGILIILVVSGHVIPGTLQNSLPRWLIYSFHMPLFMGVSGYLVNRDKLCRLTWKEFVIKYLHRIIIPWIFAVIFFYIATAEGSYSIISLAKAFVKPYYHLWFAVAYCIYLLITKLIIAMGGYYVLIISSLVTILFKLMEFDGDGVLLQILGVIQYTLRPQMFVFFYLGYAVRNCLLWREKGHSIWRNDPHNNCAVTSVLLIFYAVVETVLYFNYRSWVDIAIYLALNLCLVLLITGMFSSGVEKKNNFLEFIGRNSLPIYLWHVAAILIIKYFLGIERIFIYYLANAVVFVIEVFVVRLFNNISFVRKYIFGNIK